MAKLRPLSETKFINDANLVSYWKLDGNSTDSKGSNNGTDNSMTYGTSYAVRSNFGQGGSFNGSSSTISTPTGALPSGLTTYTISFWFYATNLTNQSYLIGKVGTGYQRAVIWGYNSGKLEFYDCTGSVHRVAQNATTINTWHFCTWVFDGTSMQGYLDGALNSPIDTYNWSIPTNTDLLFIGSASDTSGYFNGNLDDVAIFSRALSSAEVNELYQGMTLGEFLGEGSATTKLLLHLNGNSTDSSGNSNNGTDTSITYSLVNGKFGQGAGFNGTNSYIATAASIMNADKTIIAWVKTSATTLQAIANQWSNPSWLFGINTDGKLDYSSYDGSARTDFVGNTVVNTGVWTMVAATYTASSNAVVLYINGFVDKSGSTRDEKTSTTTEIWIGRENQATVYIPFNGSIDEVIISNTVWSAAKIAKYFSYAMGRWATL